MREFPPGFRFGGARRQVVPNSRSRRLCVEPLEERTLLSINGFGALDVEIDPPEDTMAPEAAAIAMDVTRAGGSLHLIRVQYRDDVAVDVSDIDDSDLRVVGPGGFDEAATMVFGNAGFDGTPRWAYYRVAAPDGSWDPADNGVYTMVMQEEQVSDTSDNFVAAGDLGTFTVDIVAPPEASLTVANITEESNETHQFQVEYSGEQAIDVSDLDNRDVWVRGPRFWQYATFVEADSQDDATPVTATYEITAPGDDWDSTDNGTYQVYMLPGAVTDIGNHFVRSGLLGTFDVEIDPPEDTTAPEATARALDIVRAGGSSHLIRVQYADNVAVDVSDIDDADLRVLGPGGFDEAATMVFGNAGFDGTPRWAYYRVAAPDGSWDPADNGVYTMVMQEEQVSDTSDNFVAAGDLGTFTVEIVAPPEASLTVANITEESNETHQFQVEYSGEQAIDVSDLDNRDVWVRGPRFWQYATFVEADSEDDATPVTATYEITAPGDDWDSTDNGTYQVYMLSGAVTDIGNHFVRSGLLGTFDVEIAAPPDTTAPEAKATAVDIVRAGGSSHLIRVQFSDDVAVDVSDIDDTDLRVVGPGGFDEAATMVFGNAGFDGTPRWAYYRVAAPDGSWDLADNGVYTMVMQEEQVSDTSDNFVAAGDLGTFTVDIVAPPEASLTVANITEESNETHQFQVEYSGEQAIDVSDLDNRDVWIRGPGYWQYATFVEADSQDDATPVTATYEITAPGDDWDSTDNGTYQVYMLPGAVTDIGNHFVRSGLLGMFDVEIAAPPAVLAAVDEALATTDFE